MRKIKKILAATMALTMLVSATGITACDFGGSRELTAIVIANGSYDASYTLNETVSFADIVITAKYNDASTEGIDFSKVKVFLAGEDITNNLNKITESVGTKLVTIEYEGKTAKLTITVSTDVGGGDVTEPVIVSGFEAPSAYTTHLSKKAAAGKTAYTKEKGTQKNAYETEFAKGDDMFMAGDDNEFKFLPTLRFLDANDQPETATKFPSTTTVSLHNGTEYGALESRAKEGAEGVVEYFEGDTVYLTANTENNTYDFADAAIGKQFKLAVLPAGNFQYTGTKSVDCEVKVVDGFNVYTAKQLGVIDNDYVDVNQDPNSLAPRDGAWDDIKVAEGLVGVNPTAVIFQNDITMTKDDIPAAMQYTLTDKEVVYYEDADAQTKENPIAGSNTFLYDYLNSSKVMHNSNTILYRSIAEGESFAIYGNYFNLDLSKVPLVASFGTDEGNTFEDGYGSDTSNASFLVVDGVGTDETPTAGGNFAIKNLDVKGNANIEQHVYVTKSGDKKAVYAGGLIFVKTGGLYTNIENVLARTFFIPLMPHGKGEVATYRNVKVYDSYQDAAFIWGKNTIAFENCNFERAGGPLMIAQDIDPEEPTLNNFPTITADENSNFVNMVTGQEFWFNLFGAQSQIASIRALDQLFAYMEIPKAVTSEDKMNMVLLSMPIGSDLSIIGQYQAQISFTYTKGDKAYALDRVNNRANWMTELPDTVGEKVHDTLAIFKSQYSRDGMVFNAGDAMGYMTSDTSASLGYITAQGPVSLTQQEQLVYAQGFAASEYLSINFGGFGLFLEFFTTQPQA